MTIKKEPWRMLPKEYLVAYPPKGKGIGGGRWSALDWHRSLVLTAIDELKPVPNEVLKALGLSSRARLLRSRARRKST